MKKILFILLTLCSIAGFSQSLPNVAFPTTEAVADTYTVNITNYGASYNDKVALINFRTANGGPATLNITPSGGSALGARPLRKKNSSGEWVPLASGDIPGDSSLFLVHYSTACGCLRIVPQSTSAGGSTPDLDAVLTVGSAATISSAFNITTSGGFNIQHSDAGVSSYVIGNAVNTDLRWDDGVNSGRLIMDVNGNRFSGSETFVFTPTSTESGVNVGSIAGDPSSPENGDLWYDQTANELTARINGSNVALGSGGGGGTTTNAVTFNNSGSGAASGTTFDGSVARTISYNTIGAQPALTFTASDFNEAGQTVSLDYANGQKANESQPGYITSADWLAHSRKAVQRWNYVNAQTGTSYTALATDSVTQTLVTMNNASPNNFIIPTNATLPYRVNTFLWVKQIGDGETSFVGADGSVTLTYTAGVAAAASKNTLTLCEKTGTNTWTIHNGTPPLTTGDLTLTDGAYINLTATGTTTNALFEDVDLNAEISGVIPIANGGTGLSSFTAGDFIWASATNTLSAKNVFATTQTAYMHLKPGTATASTAPIKLTTGTVNTTAEAGAFEYTTPQLFFTNGRARRQEIPQIQQSRVSTQFDATSNTTLANVTGLSVTVAASGTYRFEAELYTTSNIAGGVKFAIAGTATATNIIYECTVIDTNVNAAQTRATALATAVGGVTAVTVAYAKIRGTITVNGAGTLTVQFAQNASNGSASSVLVGSTFLTTEML